MPNVAVLSVSAGRDVLWAAGRSSGTFRAGEIILATGGSPRPIPFPGWTLDGVIGVGAVRSAIASGSIKPGRVALVAGTGPRLLGAAVDLHEAGVRVAGLLEAGMPGWVDRSDTIQEFPGFPEAALGAGGRPSPGSSTRSSRHGDEGGSRR